jgi:hypothetical protein
MTCSNVYVCSSILNSLNVCYMPYWYMLYVKLLECQMPCSSAWLKFIIPKSRQKKNGKEIITKNMVYLTVSF